VIVAHDTGDTGGDCFAGAPSEEFQWPANGRLIATDNGSPRLDVAIYFEEDAWDYASLQQ
jgi:hypothetical protein